LARFYLGIDGGQSGTTALIADETGAVIGRGRGGPCNHIAGPKAVEKFNHVIGACLAEACTQAGLDTKNVRFASVCLGFSGGAEDKRALSQSLIASERYYVTHDAEIALSGATAGEPGIIVIAGTGSMAFGRNAEGTTARAGGWGYIFGDEGGAFDIVRQALRAALRAEEGWGPATALLPLFLETTGASGANALLHAFYSPEYPRSRVASLAPLVDQAADSGDQVAIQVFQNAGTQLAELARGVYRQLFRTGLPVPVSPIGGALKSTTLRRTLYEQIRTVIDCPVSEPKWSPAAGALIEALRMDGNRSMPAGIDVTGK
jgi:N-acetylglucosamine kinase-like BadF-type ATPase